MKLIRTTLLLSSIAFITTSGAAQEFRLSAGYNGSNVNGSDADGWTGKAGYQFGADVFFGDRIFLRTGPHFLVRNLNYSYAEPTTDNSIPDPPAQEFKYTARSLRVPLHAGLRLLDPDDDPSFNVYAVAGPSLLLALNTKLTNDELNVTTTDAQWYVGFGAGAEIGFLFLEGGYDIALNKAIATEFAEPKVNFLYLMAGVRLKLAN